MRSFNYKTKRTSNYTKTGERIPSTFNSNTKFKHYKNQNTHQEIICAKETNKKCINKALIADPSNSKFPNVFCCYSSKYRNPILGYRKVLVNNWNKSCNDPTGTIYKDNWAKSCVGSAEKVKGCYTNKPPTSSGTSSGKDHQNTQYSQYLQRRVKTFSQLEFNFLSNKPLNAKACSVKTWCNSGNNFPTATHNSTIYYDISLNGSTIDASSNTPDCVPNCKLGCKPEGNTANVDATCEIKNKGVSPCDVRNNHAIAVYKRSNPKFSNQGAVSGCYRINRLRYQNILKAQSMSHNSSSNAVIKANNAVNGTYPVSLYHSTKPVFKSNKNPNCYLRKRRTGFGRL